MIALVLTLLPALASANGRFPASGQIAFHPGDPDVIVVQATFGLLISRDGGDGWSWACEDVLPIGPIEDPPIAIAGAGHVIAAASRGLRRSTPDACDWEVPSAELADAPIQDVVRDPSEPARAYVITGWIDAPNAVWQTEDHGGSWTSLAGSFDDVLETVEVAPSDPQVIYAAGRATVYRSPNGGGSWDSFPVDGALGLGPIYLAAVDPIDPARIYARADGTGSDVLLVSDDGGEHWREVLSLGSLLGFARSSDGATIWAGGPGSGLWRSMDRGERFEQVSDFSPTCLAARDTELWACGDQVTDGFTLGRSLDRGATFEPLLRFTEIRGPIACPVASRVATVCEPLWPPFDLTLGLGGADASAVDASSMIPVSVGGGGGCACAASPANGSGGLIPVLAAIAYSRTRRRRSAAIRDAGPRVRHRPRA